MLDPQHLVLCHCASVQKGFCLQYSSVLFDEYSYADMKGGGAQEVVKFRLLKVWIKLLFIDSYHNCIT